MNLLLLPGNSAGNKEWIDGLAEAFRDDFDEVVTIHYDHWETGEKIGSIDIETEKAVKAVEKWKDYVVLGKSFGCVVALNMLKKVTTFPSKLYLVGFPVTWARVNGFPVEPLLEGVETEIMFIQKPLDPAYPYEKLKDYLEKMRVSNYCVHEYLAEGEPKDDHHYASYDYLKRLVTKEIG